MDTRPRETVAPPLPVLPDHDGQQDGKTEPFASSHAETIRGERGTRATGCTMPAGPQPRRAPRLQQGRVSPPMIRRLQQSGS
jgi:hypothetical protein